MNSFLRLLFLVALALSLNACTNKADDDHYVISADRIFDGHELKTGHAVVIEDGRIISIITSETLDSLGIPVIKLGDATLLPGFIDLHTHLSYQHVPAETVLKHGVTTVRDLGGPVHHPLGGDGHLRVLSSGLILTAPHGYPINRMGADNLAIAITSEHQAREVVRQQVSEGAVIIKLALEAGGELGAPWSSGRAHHKNKQHTTSTKHDVATENSIQQHHNHLQQGWPLLPLNIVKAIVDEAHQLNRKVTAHIGEERGAELALDAGVDEWAHIPCSTISTPLLQRAVQQKVAVVTTLDTLSKCSGIEHNTKILATLGANFLYGAEIAHPDIPWGIDAQELLLMKRMANMTSIEVLQAATSRAATYLDMPKLGRIEPDALADMIAVKGNPLHSLKLLEHPSLVVSEGKIIVNTF